MYFAITRDSASTLPSGVTINGICSKGALPAETTKQDFEILDSLHLKMAATNLQPSSLRAQDNERVK